MDLHNQYFKEKVNFIRDKESFEEKLKVYELKEIEY